MDIEDVVQELTAERNRIDAAIAALQNGNSGVPRSSGRRGPRHMSAESRARIAAAQRKRWAKVKGQSAGSAQSATTTSAPARGGPRRLGAAARARIAAARRARWAKVKVQKKK